MELEHVMRAGTVFGRRDTRETVRARPADPARLA
jgi:hypothetical protein